MNLMDENQEIDNYAPVSVIIPCYNCEDTILRAVNSVVEQTWKPKEIILVNDCSQDNTLEILKKIQMKFGKDWIKIINLPENEGPSYARNAGWDMATQPYMAFLDADDSWHPKKIEIQCNYMKSNPDVFLTSHGWELVKNRKNIFDSLHKKFNVSFVSKWKLLLFTRYFITPAIMIKRECPYRFPISMRYSEDHFLYLWIVLEGNKFAYLNVSLAYLYKAPYGEGGLSQGLSLMEKGELESFDRLYSLKLLNKWELIICNLFSLVKYIRRKILVLLENHYEK